jgi:two-component system NarL family sensor kinase
VPEPDPHFQHDATLTEIIDALSMSADVPQALSRVLSLVAGALGLQSGWVWLCDAETSEFYGVAAQNLPPYLQDPVRMTGSTCWCIEAFRQHRLTPENIDMMMCSRLSSASGPGQVEATGGLRYHATVPLYFQDRPIGIMNIAAPKARTLTPEELRILSTVAYQAGLAVERGRLAEEKARLARAEERTRIARDIHDTLAQGLAAIILHIEGAMPHLEANPALARERLQKALAAAQNNLEDARRSVLDLRATPLDGKPLPQAIRSLARSFASETGIRVTLNVHDVPGLDTRAETEIYRIAQEALTNVRRHADAKRVQVCLESVEDGVTLAVTDDGIGFQRKNIRDGAHGLIGMRERARLIGGTLRISGAGTTFGASKSESRRGTRILVHLPASNARTGTEARR